jgi:hypothetical protein
VLHNGTIYKTWVSGEFNGCDFDKVYRLDNGLIFQCAEFRYTYAYHPAVKIFVVEGRDPIVQINNKKYSGKLFKTQ